MKRTSGVHLPPLTRKQCKQAAAVPVDVADEKSEQHAETTFLAFHKFAQGSPEGSTARLRKGQNGEESFSRHGFSFSAKHGLLRLFPGVREADLRRASRRIFGLVHPFQWHTDAGVRLAAERLGSKILPMHPGAGGTVGVKFTPEVLADIQALNQAILNARAQREHGAPTATPDVQAAPAPLKARVAGHAPEPQAPQGEAADGLRARTERRQREIARAAAQGPGNILGAASMAHFLRSIPEDHAPCVLRGSDGQLTLVSHPVSDNSDPQDPMHRLGRAWFRQLVNTYGEHYLRRAKRDGDEDLERAAHKLCVAAQGIGKEARVLTTEDEVLLSAFEVLERQT